MKFVYVMMIAVVLGVEGSIDKTGFDEGACLKLLGHVCSYICENFIPPPYEITTEKKLITILKPYATTVRRGRIGGDQYHSNEAKKIAYEKCCHKPCTLDEVQEICFC